MLTLQLTLNNKQIVVHANGQESHSFSLLGLGQTDKEWKDFFKDPRPYGGKLFQALFKDGTSARKAFEELSKQSERTIVLVLASSELDGIAWEYAYHDNAYVVEDFAFLRALPEKERPHSNGHLSKNVERVPLLFIPANPLVDLSGEPMHELDIESEWREMTQHIINSNAPFDLIELRPATPSALQSVMARFQNGMIAHFSGHGAATKDGAFLLFENENGSSNPLEAREFVREVKDQAWIGFLSACQSAVAERTEFGNLARELVKAGVPFALGMQFNLPDPFAPNISGQFYNYLSQGHAVPEAARQARRAVKRENEFYVGMIALYAAHPSETGKMGWTGSGARTLPTFAAADVSGLPTPSGFIGRQRELMNIGTSLLKKKKPNTVTLHGAGGIGKTALMHQALLRFAPSFESTFAIVLDPMPSLESALGRIERFMSLPSPCSNDTKERERIVRERLTSKRTLLGLDNFETLNYALNEKDSDEEKTAKSLHAFFKSLAANGVTLCVTSREVTNLPGETIEDIQGLTNENGGRLFQENVVRQKDEIYIEKTQQVSEMVGGHPLALRLLASTFDDQVGTSLDQYIEDLQSHLPKARDKWTEEDRHESLRASFDFTMNNLLKTKEGEKLHISLSRLSVFSSPFTVIFANPILTGAMYPSTQNENEVAKEISFISSHTANIFHDLWARGLLEANTLNLADTKEKLHVYHFHPTIRLFTKELLTGIERKNIMEVFFQSMTMLADIAARNIGKDSLWARIAYDSIPDLLVASEMKKDEETALMQYKIGLILDQFGFVDEAFSSLEKSHATIALSKQNNNIGVVLNQMGVMHLKRGNLDKATQLFQQSLQLEDMLGDLRGKASVSYSIASAYMHQGFFDKAIDMYLHSLKNFESLSDDEGMVATCIQLGEANYNLGNIDEALAFYNLSLKIVSKTGDIRRKALIMFQVARISVMRDDLEIAIQLHNQSIEIADRLFDLSGKAANLAHLAAILSMQGKKREAIECFEHSLEIFGRLGDSKNMATTLLSLTSVYIEQGILQKAEDFCSQALDITERCDFIREKSEGLTQMANIHFVRGDTNSAILLYRQSLSISETIGYKYGKASTLHVMGCLFFNTKKYDQAIKCFTESLEIFEEMSAFAKIQTLKNLLIQIRQSLGDKNFNKLWGEIVRKPIPEWLESKGKRKIFDYLFRR